MWNYIWPLLLVVGANTFYNICAKVTRDTDGDGETDQFGCYGYTWQDALTANGASLFTEDGSSCLISEPKAVQAVAFAQRLGKLTAETAPSARDFDEGKVAFRPFLFSDYRTYQPYPWRIKRYSDFSWDCIPMPHGPAGGNSSELSTVLAGISSRSAHTTLAWQFLCELTANADNQSMLFTNSHSVSALRSVTDSDETRRILRQDTPGESRNGVEMLSDVMEQAVAAPRFRNYDQALLLEIAEGFKSAVPCTACRYCVSHCPQGLDIPFLLSLYNEHCFTGGGFIAPMALASVPEDKQPGNCVGCRSCEAVCPQQIKISEAMADFSEKLNG